MMILPPEISANPQASVITYDVKSTGDLENVLYQNSSFYQCSVQKYCQNDEQKRIAIFLKEKKSGQKERLIPTFLECHNKGQGIVTLPEGLVSKLNEKSDEADLCAPMKEAMALTMPNKDQAPFVADAMNVLSKYDGKCPKNDNSCFDQIIDLVVEDLKSAVNLLPFTSKKATNKMGCMENMITNVVHSLKSTILLFVRDIPKAAARAGRNLWNYFFNDEKETSRAMLLSSVMPENMATALSELDFSTFYDLLRKNFFNFLGNIRTFYSELLGCMEWSGAAYESECLKKTDWSCPSCGTVMNFTCGLVGQLGTGYLLGGMLGSAKSLLTMNQFRKAISKDPRAFKFNFFEKEQLELKKFVGDTLKESKQTYRMGSHQFAMKARPVSNFLTAVGDELKLLSGMGSSFLGLVQKNPLTLPYHYFYQRGKQGVFKKLNDSKLEKGFSTGSGSSVKLARLYAAPLQNIDDALTNNLSSFKKITGKKFHQGIYDDLMKRHFDSVSKELSKVGVKVEKLPDNKGLKLSKGGENYNYTPKFDDKLKLADGLDNDSLKNLLVMDDATLGGINALNSKASPNFLKDMHTKSKPARNLYAIKADSLDGFVYLGHFVSQIDDVPKTKSCVQYLTDYEHYITEEITDDKKERATP
ncbi:hypothetical protein [Bacteriovorax sp. BSW11_IV]|uniref:hypothetical protein n=1 Tax=Bacteriovorax sp. BSW11_IV TaxID=1353529 RepID=UPI0012DCBD3A|nr:hypothetical protein [Bacteriovorax sp. BSW11_IV]